ncbi:MAG: cellulose synthase subunit BcsC [Candidatus Hydrogenedentes bacterium ADurb.Bin179]|nr:MAG: cellulose synthase subunit BcsC [Candidatus Hydrogenedentes bacterium ADurb.Bin179]
MNHCENHSGPADPSPQHPVQAPFLTSGRAGILLALILLAGLAVRLSYLYELQEHPDFQIPMYFQVDMGFIDNSALDHAQNARALLHLPPIEPQFERNIVWRHNPGNPQLRPPLYTFFLSALYFILGDSQFGVRLAQMLLGLGSVLLAYFLGAKIYSRGAGLLMAGFMAFYWPFIIYEANLHEPVMVIFCSLLFLNAALWWLRRPGRGRALGMGLACGFYTIASAAVILFLPVLLCWSVWVLRNKAGQAGAGPADLRRPYWLSVLRQAAIILMAFFIPILPVTLLNYCESGRFVLNSFGQGITLYIGNQPESQGYLHGADELLDVYLGEEYQALRVDEKVARIDDWWRWAALARQAVRDQILEHPGWFLKLCLKRAALFWTPREISQNITEYADRLFSRTLYRIPGNFAVIFALFIVGLIDYLLVGLIYVLRGDRNPNTNGRKENRLNRAGYALVLLLILVWYAPFPFLWISAHFRAPILPAVAAFAVLACCRIRYYFKTRRWGPAIMGAAVAIQIAVVLYLMPVSYDDDIQTWLYFRTQHYAKHKEPEKELAVAERVMERAPDHLFARRIYAQALLDAGRKEEALAAHEQLLPDLKENAPAADAAEVIGLLQREFGNNSAAREAFLQTLQHEPNRPVALHGLGNIAFENGNHQEAVRYLEHALQVEPTNSNTWFLLGMARAAAGDVTRAEDAYREGMRVGPEDVWPAIGLANLLAEAGRRDEACALYDHALSLDPKNAQARQGREEHCTKPPPPAPPN